MRREYAAVGLDFEQRARIFEEGLAVLRELWTTGETSFQGEHYAFDRVSFYSGTEMGPLAPGADAATDLGGQQSPADRRHQAGGQDGARRQPRRAPHRPLRRWLDDLLPRPSSG